MATSLSRHSPSHSETRSAVYTLADLIEIVSQLVEDEEDVAPTVQLLLESGHVRFGRRVGNA